MDDAEDKVSTTDKTCTEYFLRKKNMFKIRTRNHNEGKRASDKKIERGEKETAREEERKEGEIERVTRERERERERKREKRER